MTVAVQRSGSASGSAASRRDIMGLWSSFPREQNTVEAGHSTASETWGTASRPVPALTRLTSLPYLAVASPASSLPAPSPPSPPSAASSSSAACSIHPPHRAAPHRNAPQRTATHRPQKHKHGAISFGLLQARIIHPCPRRPYPPSASPKRAG